MFHNQHNLGKWYSGFFMSARSVHQTEDITTEIVYNRSTNVNTALLQPYKNNSHEKAFYNIFGNIFLFIVQRFKCENKGREAVFFIKNKKKK